MKIYDVKWPQIPRNNWPRYSEVFVCGESQPNLPEWCVGQMGKDQYEDLTRKGLFWEKEHAILFARSLEALK